MEDIRTIKPNLVAINQPIAPLTDSERKAKILQDEVNNVYNTDDLKNQKRNNTIIILAKASIVPIALYSFSKYKNYNTKKTIIITTVGTVVILGAVVINGLSGAWSGTTILDSLIGKIKKPDESKLLPQVK
jgi:hypothetical protein